MKYFKSASLRLPLEGSSSNFLCDSVFRRLNFLFASHDRELKLAFRRHYDILESYIIQIGENVFDVD